uniref:Ig-like domain-containing protein n=1 Tax=Moschus moschiferus TaxID=68415 RepID=A0A8C6FIE4_MOSMO
ANMHSAIHSILLIVLLFRTNGDAVNQTEGPVTVSEGALMTLNCTYQTTFSNSYLFWYVQHLNRAPQLLLKGLTADKKVEHEGFQASLVRRDSSFHLQKRAVQASDSAVYYCALSDTVREGCRGAERKPRVRDGALLWAALGAVLFLSPRYCQSTSSSAPQSHGPMNSSIALQRGLWGRTVQKELFSRNVCFHPIHTPQSDINSSKTIQIIYAEVFHNVFVKIPGHIVDG